jgi:hypothetical protein
MIPKRITRALVGRPCIFAGFDGHFYLANVTEVQHRIATIAYRLADGREITTYIGSEHRERLAFAPLDGGAR